MNDVATRALARLREGGATAELAAMVVDQTLATPITAIASPRWLASHLAATLEAGSGDAARAWAKSRLDHERARWADAPGTLRDRVPAEVEAPLRDLLGRPWSPDLELTGRVLDQAAIREVLRLVLTNGILRSRKRLSEVDNRLGGLGKRAARRGAGLLGGLRETVSGSPLGGFAHDLVDTLKEEVEGTLDGRVAEFAATAARAEVMAVAAWVADPANADAFAALRLAILDVLLDTPLRDLLDEVEGMGPDQALDVVFGAVRAAVAAEGFVDRAEARIRTLLEEAGDGTLGAWLTEVELLDVWRASTTELVDGRLRAVVATDAFAAWWAALHA